MRTPKILALLAGGIAVSMFLFHVMAAETQYELNQPTSVTAGGQTLQLQAGQTVSLIGSPNGSGDVMIRVVLPDGSLTIAQIPSSNIRVKAAVAAALPPPAAAPAPGAVPPPAAAPLPPAAAPIAAVPPVSAPATAPAPAPLSTSSSSSTGGNDAQSKYNTEGGGGNQPEHTDWKLVWEDDFSKDNGKIDTNKWSFQIDGKGGGNGEQEYYSDSPKNAHIENGVLVMTALKGDAGHAFTSAKLWTKGKYELQYGRIEACIKAPKSQMGNWPAFWMMPHEPSPYGGWPNCGEIDIMEVINMEDKLYGTNHFGKGKKQGGAQIAAPDGDFSKDYHVYAVEWEPKVFRWYLDGKCYGSLKDWESNGAPFPAPFNQKFYIILNYALGGAWPTGVAHHKTPDATSVFPQSMFVKYVRVFQPQ